MDHQAEIEIRDRAVGNLHIQINKLELKAKIAESETLSLSEKIEKIEKIGRRHGYVSIESLTEQLEIILQRAER